MSGAPVYAYRRGYKQTKQPREDPEHRFQVLVTEYLELCLSPDVEWGSTLNGVWLSHNQRARAKASGFRPGVLDMYFIINRRTFWAENKSDVGRLTTDQRRFISRLHPDAWALWRTLDDVAASLTKWGAELRALPGQPGSSRT